MAAAMRMSAKLSKSERKALKKQNKARHNLLKHDGIQTSKFQTQHLLIGNGGLDNGVQYSELQHIFSPFGDIVDILMQPGKSYAFLSFATKDQAKEAFQHINAKELEVPEQVSISGLKFYLNFVEEVPGTSIPSSALPPGIILLEDFVDEDYEEILLKCVNWEYKDPHLSLESEASLKHREVHHYGYEFMYSINNVDPEKPLKAKIPAECNKIIDKLLAAGHLKVKPDQLTVNQYKPGQGIPPHIDTHSAFEDPIVSLSLGSQAVMEFQHPDGTHIPVFLPQRSVLIMTGPARYLWTHGVTPRKSDITAIATHDDKTKDRLTLVKRKTRTSFTFRKILKDYPKQCDSQTLQAKKGKEPSFEIPVHLPTTDNDAAKIEAHHVHQVYEEIASHFSDTRHTAWPKIAQFLQDLPAGSIVADIGCGNGKYLAVSDKCYKVGCDRSYSLCQICCDRGFPVIVCDGLAVPLRSQCVDVSISIAVIHHFATEERRLSAISELVRILRPGGQSLIYVWALEQERNKIKSNYLRESRIKNKHEEDGQVNDEVGKGISLDSQNEMLASTIASDTDATPGVSLQTKPKVSGLSPDSCTQHAEAAALPADDVSLEKKNVNCTHASTETKYNPEVGDAKSGLRLSVHVNRTHFESQDLLVPWHLKSDKEISMQHYGMKNNLGSQMSAIADSAKIQLSENSCVFHRYYHVFTEGELETLCRRLQNINIVQSYYDKGNWCVILEKGKA